MNGENFTEGKHLCTINNIEHNSSAPHPCYKEKSNIEEWAQKCLLFSIMSVARWLCDVCQFFCRRSHNRLARVAKWWSTLGEKEWKRKETFTSYTFDLEWEGSIYIFLLPNAFMWYINFVLFSSVPLCLNFWLCYFSIIFILCLSSYWYAKDEALN